MKEEANNINILSSRILHVHNELQLRAKSAVNMALTVRNWIIGFYITEYEQNGEDRAKYGAKLLKLLSERLKEKDLKNINERELRTYRVFYNKYPFFMELFNHKKEIRGTLSHILSNEVIRGTLPPISSNKAIRGTVFPELKTIGNRLIKIPSDKLISNLSFSHFAELIKIKDELKRSFYELECINGTWSTRELKRQIASLYYDRSGLSKDKEKLSELANLNTETSQMLSTIRNPMVFEFLDLPTNETIEESILEKALIDNLQGFLLELGNGFCLEARQKRILIDDEYFKIDMVFYHRILKCHVLVELKTEAFTHENIGQLNVYLQYYKDKIMQKDDNPPIGILLCTESKSQMVKYALADKENIDVANYKLQLPSEKELQEYLSSQLENENY